MTRIPLSIDDRDGPYVSPADGRTKSPAEAWVAIVLGALFVLTTGWHCFLLARRQSYFTWLIAVSSIGRKVSRSKGLVTDPSVQYNPSRW